VSTLAEQQLPLAQLRQHLNQFFSTKTLERAEKYFNNGQVKQLSLAPEIDTIFAIVENDSGKPYEVEIEIEENDEHFSIGTFCNCPVGSQCKHGAAALFEFLSQQNTLSTLTISYDDQASTVQETEWNRKIQHIQNTLQPTAPLSVTRKKEVIVF